MKISQDAIEQLVCKFEGCVLTAYPDPGTNAEPWTIGYGHTSAAGDPPVTRGMKITKERALDILKSDLVKVERQVANLVKVPVTQDQFDVLVDFTFNVGPGNLSRSTLLRKLNAGDYDAVPGELAKWNKAAGKVLPGLVRRRAAEADWWMNGPANDVPISETRITPDTAAPKGMAASKQGNGAIAIGALSSIGAAREVVDHLRDANDALAGLWSLVASPTFLVLVICCGLAGAIWWWRSKSMKENGI